MILINLKLVLQPVYGVTSSWLLAAVTLIFIQMQSYAEKIYMDDKMYEEKRRYHGAAPSIPE